jgi:hypothetical protein
MRSTLLSTSLKANESTRFSGSHGNLLSDSAEEPYMLWICRPPSSLATDLRPNVPVRETGGDDSSGSIGKERTIVTAYINDFQGRRYEEVMIRESIRESDSPDLPEIV